MEQFSFEHLNSTEFEEFCFRLLQALGFKNVSWRKGSVTPSSPADSGRDIEAELVKTELDDHVHLERWFVDCKHFSSTVSASHLQNLLSWSSAHRPEVALFICSGFLSNASKDFLAHYKEQNRPPFRIHTWERPELEKLTINKPDLLAAFGVGGPFQFINRLHKLHLYYITRPPFSSLDFFFKILDRIEAAVRDEMMSMVFEAVINPRYREPAHPDEIVAHLRLDAVDYEHFKAKCHRLSGQLPEMTIVFLVMSDVLHWLFSFADETKVPELITYHWKAAKHFREEAASLGVSVEDEKRRVSLIKLARISEEMPEALPRKCKHYRQLYERFCQDVIPELFREPHSI